MNSLVIAPPHNHGLSRFPHTFFRVNMDALYAGGFDEIVTAPNDEIVLFLKPISTSRLIEPLWLKAGWTIVHIEAEALKYKAELKNKRSEVQ